MTGFQFLFLQLLIVHLCHSDGKQPHRTPRQTLEDEASENKISGTWGSWGLWSSCSQTCGLGVIERSRTCLSPYQQVPWVPRSEPSPRVIQPQPPFHDERDNIYSVGPVRPSFPLHSDGEIVAPLVDPYVPRNPPPSVRYPFNRNTRQEILPGGSQHSYQRRDQPPHHRSTSNRGRAVPRTPETLWQPSPLDVPLRQDALRASETISVHRKPHQDVASPFRKNISRVDDSSQPWPFFPDSIPLLKPESWEETNQGRALPPLTPTKESRYSRRSRVRNSIRPGKYGYGKIPFSLPLHTDKDDAQRFKRHQKMMTIGTTASPRRERKKAIGTTKVSLADHGVYGSESPHRDPVSVDESLKKGTPAPRKPKRTSRSSHPSWPEQRVGSPMERLHTGFQHGEPQGQHESKSGENVNSTQEDQSQMFFPKATDTSPHFLHDLWDSWEDIDTSNSSNTSNEEDEDDLLQHNEPGNSRNIHSSSTRTSGPALQKPSVVRRILSTSSPTHSTFLHFEEDEHTKMKLLKTSAAQMLEGQSLLVKRQERKKMNSPRMFGTIKPTPGKLAGQRVDILMKNLASRHQTVSERSTQTEGSNLHDEDLAQSHRHGMRPLQDTDPTSAEVTSDEQLRYKSESSHLPRSRSQRQSPYRPSTDSGRTYQSIFRDNPSAPRPLQGDPWTSLGRNSPLTFERGQDTRPRQHHNSEPPQFNLYNPGSEDFHCVGEQKQYKSCTQEPCPAGHPDARALQCATFNSQEFMGRLYQWEAFTEVNGNQRCALNCRPIGYRFYVRHTEKVQDGTPCEAGSLDVCVDGQCLSPGCDGILGSNSTLDTCGVCGGDGSTCKFITGTFKEINVPIGYHKILEIPKGATQISVRELTWSPNYLALRNRAGKSVINGNWAIDPPGKYEAGNTVFTYTQPGRDEQEGESFTASGPTSEALDVYMIFQQDNPGVSFQFFISSPPSSDNPSYVPHVPQQEHGAPRSVPSADSVAQAGSRSLTAEERTLVSPPQARPPPPARPAGTLQRNIRIPPLPAPPIHYWPEQPQFFWKRVGNTPCSVTCGKGFWFPIFQCVSRSSLEEVNEEECDSSSKPFPQEEACNTQHCPAFWDVGNWSVCSRTCGGGIQHRQVLCRQMYANRTTMVHPQRCGNLVKPNVTQTCHQRICSHWEIQSNWSTCSVMCGVGQRTRHVRCISNQGDVIGEVECSNRLRPRTNEVCDMGPCVRSWFHNEWSSTCSSECGPGIQRRSVFCLSSSATDESQESCTGTKPSDMRVCNSGPCERTVKWYAGPWSQCSADCDEGSQRRDVICVSKLGTEFNVTDPSECASFEKPAGLQSCNSGPCGSRWFTTPWSSCSQSCLGGIQVREVRCLSADKSSSQLCDLDSRPDEKRACNTQPCSAVLGEEREENTQP
ncbi:ADAMTS-like protein 4 isoform X2 [Pseudophryne corroboree]|uniref:ADAMTS-like protein 4 isoform X2 n=1 Tax=Pseudophryne corroboree TaxID=495146 RepID=UPI003081FA7B